MDYRKSARYRRLKKSLVQSCQARGLCEEAYMDKVEEYMDFWVRRQQLRDDVDERGIVVYDPKRGADVENRNVSAEVSVSRNMMAIYAALGFRDEAAKAAPRDEDDDL